MREIKSPERLTNERSLRRWTPKLQPARTSMTSCYSSKQLITIIIKLYNIRELKNDASRRALLIFPSEVVLSSLQEGLELITVYFWQTNMSDGTDTVQKTRGATVFSAFSHT